MSSAVEFIQTERGKIYVGYCAPLLQPTRIHCEERLAKIRLQDDMFPWYCGFHDQNRLIMNKPAQMHPTKEQNCKFMLAVVHCGLCCQCLSLKVLMSNALHVECFDI